MEKARKDACKQCPFAARAVRKGKLRGLLMQPLGILPEVATGLGQAVELTRAPEE
jgi:hypothetical protein